MCIIVDANSVHELKRPTEDGKPVIKWLLSARGGLIVGGKLKRELARSGFGPTMVVLDQAGQLKKLDDAGVDNMAQKITTDGKCCSNDHHIIAAAIISGCRLLFSKDKNLHADVKNRAILDPPASIYTSKEHRHLLTECRCG